MDYKLYQVKMKVLLKKHSGYEKSSLNHDDKIKISKQSIRGTARNLILLVIRPTSERTPVLSRPIATSRQASACRR